MNQLVELDDVAAVYSLRRTIITRRTDGIIHVSFREGETIDLEDYQEGIRLLQSWGENKAYLFLYEPGHHSQISQQLREYVASDKANRYTIADAIVVRSLPHRILGNFYIKFNKPMRPTRLFSSKQEAEEWLCSFNN